MHEEKNPSGRIKLLSVLVRTNWGEMSAESTIGVTVSAISVAVNPEMEVRNENGRSLNQFYRLGADMIC